MSQQVVIFNNEFSMSSYEFLTTVINPARSEAGEAPVRNDQFLARVRDELDDCKSFATEQTFPTVLITPTGGGRQMESITLTGDQLLLVGIQIGKVEDTESTMVKRFAQTKVGRYLMGQKNRRIKKVDMGRLGTSWLADAVALAGGASYDF